MNKLKILVVEDEIIIADNICDILSGLGYQALEPALNYTEAIQHIEDENPDMAIIDIQLSGLKTGIDLAKTINQNYNFPFIFLTSNSDVATVNQAKKVSPYAFLVKPFTKEDLFSSIEITLNNYTKKNDSANNENIIIKNSLFFKDKGVLIKLLFKEIIYIKSDHVYVELFLTQNRTKIIRVSLNHIITKMSDKFIRVHRGYIINTDFLEKIGNNSLLMTSNTSIPIGKKYRENLLNGISLV